MTMWQQNSQFYIFNDTRICPQLQATLHSMFEDKIKPNGKVSNLLLPIEENATPSIQELAKDVSEIKIFEEQPKENIIEADTECIFNDLRFERYTIQHQDLMGMTVTSGSVALSKDEKNLIGISIGGGAPLCPCLYIVQIFDNTPASKDGTLQSGDELVGVNGQSVKGKTKVELHADPKQGKSLDIIMKKMKHRLVENMSSGAADALGLSRAILCNDTLVAKLNELRETETTYKRLVENAKRMLKAYFDLLQTYKSVGDIFAAIGVREPQARASEAFTKFGQYHRLLERDGIKMLKALKPILSDMGTYLNKAIPDTKLTIRKYADTKFEYLSYCLKVKEMDDEEYGYNALQEPLYRVETGNYEYRLILRCRQDARTRFARLRSDVLVKLELLENKKTQDVAYQLRRFIQGLALYHNESVEHLKDNATLFPVEDNPEEEEELEFGKEIHEYHDIADLDSKEAKLMNRRQTKDSDDTESSEQLLPDFDSVALTYDKVDKADNMDKSDNMDNLTLLTELGLADTNVQDDFGDFQNGLLDEFLPKASGDDKNDIFDKLLSDFSLLNK
ncbi:hypothetical protein SFRURICE_006549 [Spodoptera frugiperda]|nr:hypothetical protein SFRURICE_006549 [Spodoptera frugiperda]